MSIPKNVSNSDNAYYAMKALLCKIKMYNKTNSRNPIRSVLTTSFCNGSGDMSLQKSAKQMKMAYQHVMKENPPQNNFVEAHVRDGEIERLKFSSS